MKILAIDTSSDICTVSICEDEKTIILKSSIEAKTHSVMLMPLIDECFKESSLELKDIELLAVCVGPGSFTGIRIGVSSVIAFADTNNIPSIGVTSLENLAYNILEENIPQNKMQNTIYISLLDAKNSNVYCGLYRYYNNKLNQFGELLAEDISCVLTKLNTLISSNPNFNTIHFVGDGALLYKELILQNIDFNNIIFAKKDYCYSRATSTSRSAFHQYINNEHTLVTPLYLKKSQAERELENK